MSTLCRMEEVTIRTAAKERRSLRGTEAQQLERALTFAERDRDGARASEARLVQRLRSRVEGCPCAEDSDSTDERCTDCRGDLALIAEAEGQRDLLPRRRS